MKQCKQCQLSFEVTNADRQFYEEVSPVINNQKYLIPEPTLCPDCRLQRRLAWRNEYNLHYRQCDGTGKRILSVFPQDVPFPVYHHEYWYSDNWNAKDYAQDFDFSRPFFEQFEELMNKVPQLATSVFANENCEYVNQAGWNRDCYLIFEADHNEQCYYAHLLHDSRHSLDNEAVINAELCYECVDCQDCYNVKFSQNSSNCSDSWFLKNCIGCRNCFGSVGLKNKEYYFFNQKYTKEEYEKKLSELNLGSFAQIKRIRDNLPSHAQKFLHKYMQGLQNENSTGDYLYNTQNCHDCYDLNNSQDCKFVTNCRNMKKVYDVSVFGSYRGAQFCYESHEIGDGAQNVCFTDQLWGSGSDVYYSKLCISNNSHLFGCVGLKHSQYCILNKQYTKEEYEKLVPKIVDHMQKTGEWGEFFPASMSPFGYNMTMAQVYFPLKKEEASSQGYKWMDIENKVHEGTIYDIPDDIKQVNDEIVKEVLKCEDCSKGYKILAQELRFYKNQNLPIPRECPDCRRTRRFKMRNPRKLFDRKCDKCSVDIKTTYSPNRPEKIYCESCYQKSLV